MKSKYTDSWLIKKICRKNKVSQKIPLDTFLSEDSSEKNEARDLLISAREKFFDGPHHFPVLKTIHFNSIHGSLT